MVVSTMQIFLVGIVVFFVTLISAFVGLIASDRPNESPSDTLPS